MNMSDPKNSLIKVSRQPEPVSALWLAALLPSLALGGLTTVVAWVVGHDEGLSALLGLGLALVALTLTSMLHWQIRMTDPTFGMIFALTTYGLVMALMWAVYLSLDDVDWVNGPSTAFGLLAGVLGWAGGLMRGALKLREPVYDEKEARD
ncbi:hypothetical protein GCM10022223_39350 [Kineosporia mesophila]|uniref:Holin n=1 Tax=Kineosporia mesophila TaxID=566012 RepID=A0ABP6ZTY9_9ACTN|nr:hypothetical protein [Kineosporia mesophila]MCD5348559.1 hypothetical protein [Kineosporia mesophila]